jgi:hypothetical protein
MNYIITINVQDVADSERLQRELDELQLEAGLIYDIHVEEDHAEDGEAKGNS